jgi:hypothetical protein
LEEYSGDLGGLTVLALTIGLKTLFGITQFSIFGMIFAHGLCFAVISSKPTYGLRPEK